MTLDNIGKSLLPDRGLGGRRVLVRLLFPGSCSLAQSLFIFFREEFKLWFGTGRPGLIRVLMRDYYRRRLRHVFIGNELLINHVQFFETTARRNRLALLTHDHVRSERYSRDVLPGVWTIARVLRRGRAGCRIGSGLHVLQLFGAERLHVCAGAVAASDIGCRLQFPPRFCRRIGCRRQL